MSPTDWIVLLACLGAADSLYTALQQQFPQLFEFCFDRHGRRVGCHEVLHSKYARIFSLAPNSWFGVVAYLSLAIIYADFNGAGLFAVGAVIATLGLAVSLYLLYVQAFVLRKFCIFCLMSTTLMTIITVLAWTVS